MWKSLLNINFIILIWVKTDSIQLKLLSQNKYGDKSRES